MAASFSPYAAYNARVKLDTGITPVVAHRWAVTVHTDAIDATNFEGGGYGEQITGVVGADVTIEFLFDSLKKPFTDANFGYHSSLLPSMSRAGINGYNYSNVQLFPNAVDNSNSLFTFPELTLVDVSVDASVRDAVKVTLTCKSDGAFTYPL